MKKILVLADSHTHIDNLQNAIDAAGCVDYIFHLGDHASDMGRVEMHNASAKVLCVKGNGDLGDFPTHRAVIIEGHRIVLTHGHLQRVKQSLLQLSLFAAEQEADIVLYGHTHVPDISYASGGRLLLNPGSIGVPRRGDPTYCILKVDANQGVQYDM